MGIEILLHKNLATPPFKDSYSHMVDEYSWAKFSPPPENFAHWFCFWRAVGGKSEKRKKRDKE
jgi:hypothetical protein